MLIDSDIIGTTLILIANDALTQYQQLTGAVLDNATGMLTVTSTQFAKLQNLTFVIDGVCILLWSFSLELLIYPSDFIRVDS